MSVIEYDYDVDCGWPTVSLDFHFTIDSQHHQVKIPPKAVKSVLLRGLLCTKLDKEIIREYLFERYTDYDSAFAETLNELGFSYICTFSSESKTLIVSFCMGGVGELDQECVFKAVFDYSKYPKSISVTKMRD